MARTVVDRQLARVRGRLFLSSLLLMLAWAWLIAVGVAAAFVLVQPWAVPGADESLRWAVAGGLMAVATVVAAVLACRHAPTPVQAALALDERFALKERVTTSMTLGEDEAATPAGQALRADVERKLTGVRVRDRFPIRLPRVPGMLLPVALAGLVLLVMLWNPQPGSADGVAEDALAAAPGAKEGVEEKMKLLAAKPKAKKDAEKADAKELEKINQDIENFIRKPRETREEVRDLVKDATALEEQIRQQQKQEAERVDAFREAMKQAERLTRKSRDENKQGPGNKAADALARGDMNAAKDELERLSRQLHKEEEKERLRRKKREAENEEERKEAEEQLKKLERENEMTEKEREQLAKQLAQMEDDLKRLSRSKDEKQQELRDLADKGELDKDALDRELEQLERMQELTEQEKEELKQLAKELGECKDCMREGKPGEAAKKLAKAAQKAGECKGGEGKELAQRLAQVQAVKRALCQRLSNEGVPGAGRRPEAKDDNTAHKDALVPGEWDKGKMEVIGQGPLGGFKGPRKPEEMQAEIRQAAQEAPAALDRQRLPASAQKMARGYFEKVRGTEPEKKK